MRQPDPHLVEEIVGLTPGTALDLGCGTGGTTCWLAEHGWTPTGVDWSAGAIAVAREEAARRGVKADFEVGDMVRWAPGTTFDLVLVSYALPPDQRRRGALRTAARAVKPGGMLLLLDIDRGSPATADWPEGELSSLEEVVDDLATSGLEIERREHVDVGHHPALAHGHGDAHQQGWIGALIRARRTARSPSQRGS